MEPIVDKVVTYSEGILAVVGAIGVLFMALKRVYKMARNVEKLIELSERSATRLKAVEAELKTNGGSSIKDAINRIELQQRELATKLDAHLAGTQH